MMKLTVKEEEVMEKIWQLGECTPRDVLALYEEPEPLITSISNTFQALERKGFLTHRSQGRGYVYIPAVEQKEYGKLKISSFVDKYFTGDYLSVVSEFVHEEKLSEAELLRFLADLMNSNQESS